MERPGAQSMRAALGRGSQIEETFLRLVLTGDSKTDLDLLVSIVMLRFAVI